MAEDKITNDEINQEINKLNQYDFLEGVRKRNRKKLIKLDFLERERIARHIITLYNDVKDHHAEKCDKIDEYDEIYRMKPYAAPGADADTPNYRSGLSTVNLEVVHANCMNTFFTPANTMRILPTEPNDIPKINKLEIFGNWSMKNEIHLEEKCDRLWHASGKNGENPFAMVWSKEYDTQIIIEPLMNPMDPSEPLLDENTGEALYQEHEEEKLIYDGPKLEVFSRKDYILPKNAVMDITPEWEMRIVRLTAEKIRKYDEEGKFYTGVFDQIGGWGNAYNESVESNRRTTSESEDIPLGPTEKVYIEFYGGLRIKSITEDKDGEEQYKEIEDEFIAIVEIKSETLCALRKNKFPYKMRPFGLDVFIPDDEARMEGIGIMEFMEGFQKAYDNLRNQYIKATVQANDPFGFFTPFGNKRNEPMKVSHGYLYPTSDTNSVKIEKLPPPDASMIQMMEEVRNNSQSLFGISDYAQGLESQIDPSAPARKAQLVVAQGNVRLNLIIKRKNRTLRDIFKRWFLLYQANMPQHKFMRIAGEDRHNPWKFEPINMQDFALKGIPDFELTGNVLSSNKQLELQKKLGIYQLMIANPFFAAETREGVMALHGLTKWLLDATDEIGLSNYLPKMSEEQVDTPEEENARFLQGQTGDPVMGEDHIYHIRIHSEFAKSQSLPDEVRKEVLQHIAKTIGIIKQEMTQQAVMAEAPNAVPGGGYGQTGQTPQVNTEGLIPEQGMGALKAGVNAGV